MAAHVHQVTAIVDEIAEDLLVLASAPTLASAPPPYAYTGFPVFQTVSQSTDLTTLTGKTLPLNVVTPSLLTVNLQFFSYAQVPDSLELAVLTVDRLVSFWYTGASSVSSTAVYAEYGVAYSASSATIVPVDGAEASVRVPMAPAPISVLLPPGRDYMSAVVGPFVSGSWAAQTLGYTLVPVAGATSTQTVVGPAAQALYNWDNM